MARTVTCDRCGQPIPADSEGHFPRREDFDFELLTNFSHASQPHQTVKLNFTLSLTIWDPEGNKRNPFGEQDICVPCLLELSNQAIGTQWVDHKRQHFAPPQAEAILCSGDPFLPVLPPADYLTGTIGLRPPTSQELFQE